MALFDIKMPKLGESITEGTIMKWHVSVGDVVKEDDVLFEVSTQKVSAEIPSPISGKIMEILAGIDETVAIGTIIARILPEGEEAASTYSQTPTEKSQVTGGEAQDTGHEVQKKKKNNDRFYSPLVMQMAKDSKISMDELDQISGTGYQGRVSKQDIERYLDGKNNQKGTRYKEEDKQTDIKKSETPKPPVQVSEGDEVIEMDFIRKVTADHMLMSKKTSPHVTSVIEIDVTKLVHWNEKNKDEFLKREGIKLTFMPAITEAVAKALIEFPRVNASVNEHQIILKKQINIGIAVALENGNLIVPVIHHADELSLNGLAVRMDDLAKKARNNKLSPDDISGGTFTITNFGTFKTLFATPIINQPQVAILGVGYIEKKPAVVETPDGDVIAIRHKMYLSLSYDHRIIDGALGGKFLRRIGDLLESYEL